jgi:ornithine--oxo-acid transaminase
VPGFVRIPYGDAKALQAVLKKHGKNVAGFLVEPIQGEAGVMIPPAGFFKKARELCTKHNVLLMADEVQSGVGRTGKLLAIQHEGIRPDVVVLAKALGGGILPVAAVLADKKIMNVFEPGTHGSTFGGNPLASAVGIAALDALKSDKIVEQSASKGKQLAAGLKKLQARFPNLIHATRCRGLWGAIETKHDLLDGHAGKKLAQLMLKRFVLAKVTHDHTIRLSPPLVITEAQLSWSLRRIAEALEELNTMVTSKTPKLAAPKKKAAAKKQKLLPVSVKKAQKKVSKKAVKKTAKKH